ncbi:hypothetical protein [Proteiniclasticum sp.]|uniref:hypothetical protein n=1 Tax=Proteiniclasticum sp. TaxID=2053595 RepID=UPI00289F772A|nr:hypothetical protein [Proteiniclasticum sp.]
MIFNYTVKFQLANDRAREGFSFLDIEDHVKEAIKVYHESKTVRHKKTLSYTVTKKILEMNIISPVELEFPSKALAKFTRTLVSISPELARTITNGRVFQSVETTIPASDLDNYSSKETIKRLIDIFCEDGDDSEAIEKRNARLEVQRKIKAIIFNAE